MSEVVAPPPAAPVPEDEATGALSLATYRKPRLWPAVVIVVAMWLGIVLSVWLAPQTMAQMYGMFFGPMIATALFAIWWLFASRVRWRDRFLVLVICGLGGFGMVKLGHSSLGFFALIIDGLPVVMTVWTLWLLATRSLAWPTRRWGLVGMILAAWGVFLFLRFEGTTGNFIPSFAYRWSPTIEDRFLAERSDASNAKTIAAPVAETLVQKPGDWPGFRGQARDARLAGIRIATDWHEQPPRQIWRRHVGPGWSSFAVIGNRAFTQEQRGPVEVVVCYDADSGRELWVHTDSARFSENVGGPGPRATPTFHEGKIYAMGATGLLNCLDAATGRLEWSRDIRKDSSAKLPMWGFASSPLVSQGLVTVFAGDPEDKVVLAYDAKTGKPAWHAGKGEKDYHSYCSLQPARLAGVDQLVISTAAGLLAFHPTRGDVLWQYTWPSNEVARIVQPTIVGDCDVLIGTGFGLGTRRVHVKHDGDKWTTEEVWSTKAFKPYFNDQVVSGNHAYGFDSSFFACLSLADGKLKWKERRYGSGQVLLLVDQDLLLVSSEQGKVALVEASPDRFKEVASFQALEGKTWNHPVVAHGKLFIRNGEEMACYQLALENGGATARK
jgi:outer membrane protein assembly factor BamB